MLTTLDVDNTPLRKWFGYQVLTGIGIGPGFQTGVLVVQTVLPQDMVPVGVACVQFFQALGGAVFVAVAQTLFQNGIIDGVARLGFDGRAFINSGANEIEQVLARLDRLGLRKPVLEAYMTGLRHTFFISVAAAACAFFCILGLEWKSVKKSPYGRARAKEAPALPA
ncbi:hypothetical protein CDD80_2323 [Ophiocordyceps camponoti-rufipedis]|uniref:Major facilitator superfamily (MFS) profile domain-containing protein n=1 Tax=Ophiocordyceps camponoti-rufipedis TaxID=2004952 RepID=A0A2C5XTL4_9HYPO|nr:hypothetical protein CDD80_2323 [Ophiocordyceps camponoti-rufipedis]